MLSSKSTAILLHTKSQLRIVEDQGTTHLWEKRHPYRSVAFLVLLQGANYETSMETLSRQNLRAKVDQSHRVEKQVTLRTLGRQS